jgi:hypothetical protein
VRRPRVSLPAVAVIAFLLAAASIRGDSPAQQAPVAASAGEELIAEKDATAPLDDEEDVVSVDGLKAAWRTPRGNKWAVMLNGARQGGEFEEVKSLTFGGGGEHLAFRARNGKTWFVVLDGKEGTPFDEIGSFVFSGDGNRTAYTGKRDKKWFVVVDGSVPEASYEKVAAVVFSPDAKRLAFARKSGKWAVQVGRCWSTGHPWVPTARPTPTSWRASPSRRTAGTSRTWVSPAATCTR